MINQTTFFRTGQILTQLKPELTEKYFVNSIGLFGSIVREDFTDKSDVDIIVDFSKPIGIEFIDLADYIESKLNNKVDLVSKNGVKPKYFNQIEAEIIYV
ncbi:MAG: nucleotidyltransferase family protein [Ginsengibacter sp.]